MSGLCGPISGDGIPNEVGSPFCNAKTNIAVRQSKSLEDREIGKQFAPVESFGRKAQSSLPEGDDAGTFIVTPCARRPFTRSQH